MDKTYKCSRCKTEFTGSNSLKDYQKHLADRGGDPKICRAPGAKNKPDVVLDIKKNKPEVEEQKEDTKVPPKPEKPVKSDPTPSPGSKKLELVYKWQGQHDKCGSDVKTIVLQTVKKDKWVLVAYCPNCDKQLRERPVERL